jgi:hypothetical protein
MRKNALLAAAATATLGLAFIALAPRAAADVFFDAPADASTDALADGSTATQSVADASASAAEGAPGSGGAGPTGTAIDGGATPSGENGWVAAPPIPSSSASATTPASQTGAGAGGAASGVPMPDGGTNAEYTGLSIGVRSGFSLPIGAAKSSDLGAVVQYVVPIGIDVGWYLRPNFYLGGYFLYGFASPGSASDDTCPSGSDTSCSAQDLRFGVAAEYAFRHRRNISPWVRAGLGLDVVNLTATDSSGATAARQHLFGIEWAVLGAGLDFKPGYYYGLGPYLEAAVGDYFNDGLAAPHVWATLGLRLRTGLFVQ